jgi:hypothetical protein
MRRQVRAALLVSIAEILLLLIRVLLKPSKMMVANSLVTLESKNCPTHKQGRESVWLIFPLGFFP